MGARRAETPGSALLSSTIPEISKGHLATRMPSIGVWLAMLCLGVGGYAVYFVDARGQDQNWDLLNYHYYSGYAFLNGGLSRDVAAAGIQTYLHPAVNAVSYLALRYLAFPFSAWLILSVQLLSLPLLAMVVLESKKGLGPAGYGFSALLALALTLLAPLWWGELGTTFFSSSTTPLVLLSVLMCMRQLRNQDAVRPMWWLLIAGIPIGIASGLKLTNAPYAVALAAALILASLNVNLRKTIGRTLALSAGMTAGFALTAGWYVSVYKAWKNPLFPFYNGIFRSPYFEYSNFRDERWRFHSLAEFFRFLGDAVRGTYKTSEISFADPRLIVVVAIVPLGFLAFRRMRSAPGNLMFGAFVFLGGVIWAFSFAYQRYLIPIELLLGIFVWIIMATLLNSAKVVSFCMALLLLGCLYLTRVPDWNHGKDISAVPNAFDLKIDQQIASTPATYLVVGEPLSFVFPFLHPASVFYKLNVSSPINSLVAQKLQLPQATRLPLRVIFRDAEKVAAALAIKVVGLPAFGGDYVCTEVRGRIESYSICEYKGAFIPMTVNEPVRQ